LKMASSLLSTIWSNNFFNVWKTFQRKGKMREKTDSLRSPSRSAAWLLNFSRFQNKQTKKTIKQKKI
jgi:hypothetical protein